MSRVIRLKHDEIALWYNSKQCQVLKINFFKVLDENFPENTLTKSLNGSLMGPAKQISANCYALRGKLLSIVFLSLKLLSEFSPDLCNLLENFLAFPPNWISQSL